MIKNLISKIQNYFKQSSKGIKTIPYFDKPFHPQNQEWINNFWKSDYKKCKYLGSFKTTVNSHPRPEVEHDWEYADVYYCPIMKMFYIIHKDIIFDYKLAALNYWNFSNKTLQDKINRIKLLS